MRLYLAVSPVHDALRMKYFINRLLSRYLLIVSGVQRVSTLESRLNNALLAVKYMKTIFVGASASSTLLPAAEFFCLRVAYREAFWEKLGRLT